MKNIKYLFVPLLAVLLLACSTEKKPSPTPEVKAQTWEAFWTDFQAAVASEDSTRIMQFFHFGENLSEQDFHNSYFMFFGDDMKKVIAETSADKVEVLGEGETIIGGFSDNRSISWEESSEVDGELFESGLFIYFGRKDGKYGVVAYLAAG